MIAKAIPLAFFRKIFTVKWKDMQKKSWFSIFYIASILSVYQPVPPRIYVETGLNYKILGLFYIFIYLFDICHPVI